MLCNHDSGLTLLKPSAMKGEVKFDLSQLYMLMNKRHATGCHTLADTHHTYLHNMGVRNCTAV